MQEHECESSDRAVIHRSDKVKLTTATTRHDPRLLWTASVTPVDKTWQETPELCALCYSGRNNPGDSMDCEDFRRTWGGTWVSLRWYKPTAWANIWQETNATSSRVSLLLFISFIGIACCLWMYLLPIAAPCPLNIAILCTSYIIVLTLLSTSHDIFRITLPLYHLGYSSSALGLLRSLLILSCVASWLYSTKYFVLSTLFCTSYSSIIFRITPRAIESTLKIGRVASHPKIKHQHSKMGLFWLLCSIGYIYIFTLYRTRWLCVPCMLHRLLGDLFSSPRSPSPSIIPYSDIRLIPTSTPYPWTGRKGKVSHYWSLLGRLKQTRDSPLFICVIRSYGTTLICVSGYLNNILVLLYANLSSS